MTTEMSIVDNYCASILTDYLTQLKLLAKAPYCEKGYRQLRELTKNVLARSDAYIAVHQLNANQNKQIKHIFRQKHLLFSLLTHHYNFLNLQFVYCVCIAGNLDFL